jgi:serine/threonine-protein kinase
MHTEPAPPPVRPGEVLAGKYRVDRVLGEGGMGFVVAATNIALNQKVAVKLLRASALAHVEALGRFKREAQAAASLKSEHIARVSDIGALEDGRPYMVMEYLEGMDLGDFIEKHEGPIPVQVAVDFVLQACEAIAEAHTARIVHRDLKPRNLFLTKRVDGMPLVKVLDFGISKIETENPADHALTRTTEIIGSPSYMSPEQLKASRYVDSRTDIWAIGVILYELLTKRLPFYGNTVTELVAIVLTENEPPVTSLRPDVPPQLEHVIKGCLQKSPDQRIQTVVQLAEMLAPFSMGGHASFVDRVRGVAFQSGRISGPLGSGPQLPPAASSGALPPTISTSRSMGGGSSSARVAVQGSGTSVAWGETQVDPPRKPPSRAPMIGIAVGLLATVGAVGLGGAYVYTKRANATPTQGVGPGEPMPLPSGRKDLPPIASATPTTTATDIPSALPDSRLTEPAPTASAKTGPLAKTAPKATAKAASTATAAPPNGDDPLNNIGRR